MTEPQRPDPDRLLARTRSAERRRRRGRLKIFFGSVAGVGKTCAMLQAGKQKLLSGTDVVAGWIETHGRIGTQTFLEGFELLPALEVKYRGILIREFNLDLALQRRPELILVDELAHNNVSGLRHLKRWQDIEEILEAGIDVYTTVNVQHLESLNDDVGHIAGVRVGETFPDRVFEQADEVCLIDLPPRELLDRLRDGKIYSGEQARKAAQHFFKEGNLIALRELALRQTTQQVDAQMQCYRENHHIHDVWPVSEYVLVCIGPTETGERLIRSGKRFASALRAEWIVAYVETPELERLPTEQRGRVLQMLKFAEDLGAETVTLRGAESSSEIIRFARERNISKLVLGRPSLRGLQHWIRGSMVDTLIRRAQDINLYLLGSPDEQVAEFVKPFSNEDVDLQAFLEQEESEIEGCLLSYISGLGISAGVVWIAWLLSPYLSKVNLIMIHVLGILMVAMHWGKGPAMMASLLVIGALDFLFAGPTLNWTIADPQSALTILAILIVGFIPGHLMEQIRHHASESVHRERRLSLLYQMSRELADSHNCYEAIDVAIKGLHREFGGKVVFVLPNREGNLEFLSSKSSEYSPNKVDMGVAQWVFQHKVAAGKGTHILSGAEFLYLPMMATASRSDTAAGVLVIKPPMLRRVILPEQRKLLNMILEIVTQTLNRHAMGIGEGERFVEK